MYSYCSLYTYSYGKYTGSPSSRNFIVQVQVLQKLRLSLSHSHTLSLIFLSHSLTHTYTHCRLRSQPKRLEHVIAVPVVGRLNATGTSCCEATSECRVPTRISPL
eukprot:m.401898 g.401898  ORF g.401898 m.401898 type:complete len:105 (-) comp28402_c1_seq1:25-339(-)